VADRLNEIGIQATRLRPCDQYDRPLVEVDFGVLKHDTPYPFALFIAQHDVERVLEEHFEALGGNVLRGWKLTGLEQRSHLSYPLIARFEGGESIATKYAVGTDGSKSAVRSV
jgi:2-polyprenyl-6-methoxyphenol hydroxylase-like FAD-dependent oxidoreductase